MVKTTSVFKMVWWEFHNVGAVKHMSCCFAFGTWANLVHLTRIIYIFFKKNPTKSCKYCGLWLFKVLYVCRTMVRKRLTFRVGIFNFLKGHSTLKSLKTNRSAHSCIFLIFLVLTSPQKCQVRGKQLKLV